MNTRAVVIVAAAVAAGGAWLVAKRGREATREELSADPLFAAGVVDSMSFLDAIKAGARALVRRNPLGYQATATASANTFRNPWSNDPNDLLELM